LLKYVFVEAALKAIAGPRRRQILTLVRDGELSAGEIAGHFDITRPAVSQHLNVLKEAGLVSERRNGISAATGSHKFKLRLTLALA
jgi:DNA-binding transcriptional ArsR family regulator